MKNDFSKLGGCKACALRASGECKIRSVLHCDFFEPSCLTPVVGDAAGSNDGDGQELPAARLNPDR